MYQPSQDFLTKLNTYGRQFRARLTVGDTQITSIKSLVQTSGSCGADTFAIGSVFASYIDVSFSNLDISLTGREMFLEIGLVLPDGTDEPPIEYIPMGYYAVQNPSSVTKERDQISINAVDRITTKCSGLYVPTVVFPCSIKAVLDDIATQTGATIKCDLDTTGVIETAMDALTYRDALGYIAGLLGGFCYADRGGNIKIAAYPTESGETVGKDRFQGLSMSDTLYKVEMLTAVVSEGGTDADGNEVEGVSYSEGSGDGLTISNPYMTRALFDAMKSRVIGYSFYSGTASFLGNPCLDPEDAVTMINYADKEFFFPCMSITQDFDGGLTTTISTPGVASSDETVKGPTQKALEQLQTDMVLAKEVIAKKITADQANIKYANIDFSNIGKAAIEQFFATSGLIKDVVVGDQTVTGELVGVTIKGDLIEGGTVKADKLVIKGEDGLFYKLNVDALGETTASSDDKYQNGLDGSVIIAKSITATKIDVKDLVAFGATIGGFKISDNAIYSGVKETVDNTTRGTYLDKDGQVAFGDSNNYIKYLKDADGNYHLLVSASEIILGTGKTVEETIDDIQIGARNLIRNSNNLIYPDYGFADPSLVVTDDGAGNVDVQSGVVDFGDNGDGDVILTSELYDISDDGEGTATIDKKDGESVQKSPEMSTLTMGGKTYEVVDKYARDEVERLTNLPTRYTKLPDDGVLAVDGMYFLGELTSLTFGLPDAKNGDMIYVTFSSGSRPTALQISTANHTGLEHLSIKDNASYELIGLYSTGKWVFVTNEV